ncbi:rhodanese-like domain-containing protein [Halobium salinum]|uniref:Rhodanese-like domain-containing protein n=1 Tax=Halobium salinum TaxID=1364940 RepID=A0ABD5PC62_9EURY|nr:rhodanese-like domain-containing protein [Halobium salinum]
MDGEVSPEEVAERLDANGEGIRVVDIRSKPAFDRGHIPGSENVPFDQLADRIASLEGAERIVTVCPHGQASQQAARLIKSYEGTADALVESMAGGLEAWGGEIEAAEPAAADADEGPDAPF